MTSHPSVSPDLHAVQFYERESYLHRTIAEHFDEAMHSREPIVMIARRRTFEGAAERLALAHDIAPAEAASRMVFVDADTALGDLMDGGMPDSTRFQHMLSSLIADARRDAEEATVWVYGEMVDVLCKEGNFAAAARLEELWHAARTALRVVVLCGYALDNFEDDVDASRFQTICRLHTDTFPTEGFIDAPDERSRLEQVALLQQRSLALRRLLAGQARPSALVSPPAASSTVYIVDDDASVRQSLARLLVTVDLRVHTFASAEAFLAKVDDSASGCLILDVQLVGMSGPELQGWMTRARWPMPVIAMSASDDPQIETKALQLGACAFLRKPFEAGALFGAIARAFSKQ